MEVSKPGAENRNLERWHLIYYLRVFDKSTGGLLGHVVDINEEGVMLVGPNPLPVDRNYDMSMEVPGDNGDSSKIEFCGKALWSRSDINPDFYDTGFELYEMDADTVVKVQKLIDDLHF